MYSEDLLVPWESLTYESWARGEISWKLREEQRRIKDKIEESKVQTVVGNISRRLGKSFILVLISCERARKGGKREKIRYGAAYKTDLEEFILPAFEIILQDCPAEFRPVYKAAKQTWVFPGGATIKLVGLDKNPNGMRGNALSCVIIDEAGFVMRLEYLLVAVVWPATMKQKNIKVLIFSTPPESPEHYFVKLMDMAQADDDSVYIEMTIDEISDLDPAERERMMKKAGGEDSPNAQREYFCKIIIDPTRAVAPKFDEKNHVREFERDHIAWGIFGDTAGKDKTIFLKMGFDHEWGLILVDDEYVPKPRSATTEIIVGYKDKYPQPNERENMFTLVCNMDGQLRLDYAALGLPSVEPQKDSFDAGVLLLNNTLFNYKILIHPRCKLLIKTLKGGLKTASLNDYERSESLGHCDAAATVIYGIRGVDRVTDLRPRPDPAKIFQVRRESDQERNIKGLSWRA